MKKLYPVTITCKTMVVAENPHSAEDVAQQNLISIWAEEPYDVVVQDAIEKEENIPPEWVTCIPYGESNQLRCEEIVRMVNKDNYIKSLTKEQMNKILSHLTIQEISILLNK